MTDLQGHQVQKELGDLLDCPDSQEHQEFQVSQDRTGPRAQEELQAATELRVREDSLEVQGSPAWRGDRVHLVCQDKRETQVMSSQMTALDRKEV